MKFLNELGRRNQRENYFPIGVSSIKLKQVHMIISYSPQREKTLEVSEPNYCQFWLADCLYIIGSPSTERDNHRETVKRFTTFSCYLVLHFYQILISFQTFYPGHYVCCKAGVLQMFRLLISSRGN